MRSRSLPYVLRILALGLRQRCPACGQGRLFAGWFRLRPTCPYCHARYERASGEGVGAIYINAGLTLVIAFASFFALHPRLPLPVLLLAWTPLILLLPALLYRLSRSLWVSIAFLTGAVYPDPDYEREWIGPHQPSPRTYIR